MTVHTLSVRKTHGYVGSYSHLDKWEDIGIAKVISHKKRLHRDDEDGSSSYTVQEIMTVKLDEGADKKLIKRAIHDTFSRSGCACQHDCCGCWSIHVRDVRKRIDGSYMVYIGAYQNY